MKRRNELRRRGLLVQRPPLNMAIHQLKPGDRAWIKSWREVSPTPGWEGPFVVLLTTEAAVRTAERGWTHGSRVKGPIPEDQWEVSENLGGLKFKLRRKI